jgi:cell shape-determining protein MreC
MKNKTTIAIACLLTFYTMGCKSDYFSAIAAKIEEQMGEALNNYDNVVIIPGSGCSGCISEAETFFVKNIENYRIKFILTQIVSRKEMALHLGKENITRENVWIDKENAFYLLGYHDKIYPVVTFIENSKVVHVQLLSNFNPQ